MPVVPRFRVAGDRTHCAGLRVARIPTVHVRLLGDRAMPRMPDHTSESLGARRNAPAASSVMPPPSPPLEGSRNNDTEVMQTNNDAAVSRL